MDVQAVGPPEASVEGRPVAIGAGKPRALLALHEGSTVSAERLVDGLWGEEPPDDRGQDGAGRHVPAGQGARDGPRLHIEILGRHATGADDPPPAVNRGRPGTTATSPVPAVSG
jgi:hypothetical protein